MECAYSKNNLDKTNTCVCADGFTYDKRVIIPYIRKFKKSPLTNETLTLDSVIYDEAYDYDETILDRVRENLDDYIGVLKMSHNFSNIPRREYSILMTKFGDKYRVNIVFEKFIEDSKKNSVIKHIKHDLYSCYIKFYSIIGHYIAYLHTVNDINYLSIHGKKMKELNQKLGKDGFVELESISSFSNENNAKKWLDEIFVKDFVSAPIKLILENKSINLVMIPKNNDANINRHLNDEQKSIFDDMRQLTIISGPPGTGKTMVISTAVEYIQNFYDNTAHCNNVNRNVKHYTIVLSEKNKAISAICEKFTNEQYKKVVAFGSSESMDVSSARYLIDNKIYNHESVLNIYQKMNKVIIEANNRTKKLRRFCYKFFKKVQLNRFSWTDLEYVRYQISTKNFSIKTKRKIDVILQDLTKLFLEYENLQKNVNVSIEYAREAVTKDATILITTFGSINKVFDFLKKKESSPADLIEFTFIVDESSTVESWKVLYLEKFVNDLNGHMNQIILIGDTKQLSVYYPNGKNDEKESILDVLDSRHHTHHLIQTYRIPHKIVDLMNKHFYRIPLKVGHTRKIDNPIVWIHSIGIEDDEINAREIEMIRKTIINFTNIDKSIMIISPYKKQVELIQNMILNSSFENTNTCTIDKSQGNEADVVILSLVKSKPTQFLTKRRTNVMISRTREKLIIFGNRNNALKCSNYAIRSLAKNSGFKNL